jgi:hypothetical protein
MTEDEAMQAAGMLAGGIPGFGVDAVATFVREFEKEDNGAAMIAVCEHMARNWKGRFRPSLGDVLDAYRRHPTVAAEREMRVAEALAAAGAPTKGCDGSGWVIGSEGRRKPCFRCNPFLSSIFMEPDQEKWGRWMQGVSISDLHNDLSTDRSGEMSAEYPMPPSCAVSHRQEPGGPPAPRIVSAAEGMRIADDEHRSMYGRGIGESFKPNPVFATEVIERVGTFDPMREVYVTTYTQVLVEFRGDHARCKASLEGIGSRFAMDTSGHIALKGVLEEPESHDYIPRGPVAPPPTVAAGDRPLGASQVMSDALGKTLAHLRTDRPDPGEDF